MSEPLRAFFAFEPDEPSRCAAGAVRDVLAGRPHGDGVKWVRDQDFHVTLRFFGGLPADAVAPLVERVGAELRDLPGFDLALDGLRAFPTPRRPRVIVLDLEPAASADRLARAVERGVVEAGFEPEDRPFHGHLTLGRVRRGRRAPRLDDVPPVGAPPFPVREVVLFQSHLGRNDARYIPLERLSLAAATVTP